MSRQITTQQLEQHLTHALHTLLPSCNPDQPSLYLCPRLASCHGPSLCVELDYDTKPWASNPMGVVHGGILALMLDNSMGLTCYGVYQHTTPTITMDIHYARPVPLNQTVRVCSTILLAGSTTAQLQAQIYLPDQPQRILVSASGVYYTHTPI